MTTELITGFADTPHVDAADDGALNAAIISDHNHVLGTPSPAVMRDSNHLTVPTMQALFLGRHVRVTSAEDVTITSGSQGLKRHDIVGFRYSRDPSTNVETVVLDVIRGTASSTPADPALPSGNILTGDSSAFMPLYRVPLDGINVGTPVPLFNVLGPMRELWDSAKQLPGIKTQISNLQNSANQLPGIKTQISNLQNSANQLPVVKAGHKIGTTNDLAVLLVEYTSPNGKAPDGLVVSLGPQDNEGLSNIAEAMVWSATAAHAEIRIRKNYDGTWWPKIGVNVSWIAVWN